MTKQRSWIAAGLVLTVVAWLGFLWLQPDADDDPMMQDAVPDQAGGVGDARDTDAYPPAGGMVADSTTAEGDVPEFDIYGLTSYQDLLDQLGIDRDWAAWALNHGIIMLLEPELWQVYIAMDEAELQALADAGDVLAEFAVTQKLMIERPMEAYDRIRLLVLEGSVEAMDMMQHQLRVMEQGLNRPAQSYGWSEETTAGMQRFIERVRCRPAYRTYGLAIADRELHGPAARFHDDPGSDPGRWRAGDADRISRRLRTGATAKGIAAGSLGRNRDHEPAIEAPPIGFVALEQQPDLLDACPASELPIADLSACRQIRLRFESTVWDDYVCPQP